MSQQVTLELPNELVGRAERLATLRGKSTQEVLTDALSDALPAVETLLGDCGPVASLSDDEVMQLSQGEMPLAEDRRLSTLLDTQQAGTLAPGEEDDLSALMRVYEASLVRQSEALAESVRRGLRGPLLS